MKRLAIKPSLYSFIILLSFISFNTFSATQRAQETNTTANTAANTTVNTTGKTTANAVSNPNQNSTSSETPNPTANSVQIAGINVPQQATVGTTILTAQGAAIRSKFFFDVYVAAFYAPNKVQTPNEALTLPGAKRMWFRFLREVPKSKFVEAWREGIANNNSAATIEENKNLINNFLDLFDKDMVNGDIMTVDYIPNKGTQVSLNGKVKGTISGEHFFPMVLGVWMGEHPPNQQFQKALLSF